MGGSSATDPGHGGRDSARSSPIFIRPQKHPAGSRPLEDAPVEVDVAPGERRGMGPNAPAHAGKAPGKHPPVGPETGAAPACAELRTRRALRETHDPWHPPHPRPAPDAYPNAHTSPHQPPVTRI